MILYITQNFGNIVFWMDWWLQAVLTRKNTINGILYKDDPTIFAWELMNEPRCINNDSGKSIQVLFYLVHIHCQCNFYLSIIHNRHIIKNVWFFIIIIFPFCLLYILKQVFHVCVFLKLNNAYKIIKGRTIFLKKKRVVLYTLAKRLNMSIYPYLLSCNIYFNFMTLFMLFYNIYFIQIN